MHIRLLILCQFLVLCFTHIIAHHAPTTISALTEEVTVDSEPETTTPIDDLPEESTGTAVPDVELEGDLALAESTNSSVQGTIKADDTAAAILETSTTYSYPQRPHYPYPYPHPYAHPYAQPYPHPGAGYNPLKPDSKAHGEDSPMPKPTTPAYLGYPNPSYPIYRPPYSPYGPVFPHNVRSPYNPGFAQGPGFAHPSFGEEKVDEKKDEEPKTKGDKAVKSLDKSPEEATKLPEESNFGYPPVYFIPRRPHPSFSYGNPVRSYSYPFGYGR